MMQNRHASMPLDENRVRSFDKKNLLNLLLEFPQQLQHAQRIGEETEIKIKNVNFQNVLVCGMGGSAIGGDLLRSFLLKEMNIPILVNRNYNLPAFVDERTLIIASSYSGNTEETLTAYEEAKRKGTEIICVTSNGKLRQAAEGDNRTLVVLPSGLPPRSALGFLMVPILAIFTRLGLVAEKSKDLQETIHLIEDKAGQYHPSQEQGNLAKTISRKLYGKLPLIYSSVDHLGAVALRWKGQLCENSKVLAFQNVFPELNHNEIVGWGGLKELQQEIQIVYLRDQQDYRRNQLRMDITKRILKGETNPPIEVYSQGESLLARIFSLVYLGDFVSLYLAILSGVDPAPVEKIEYLKKELARL